MERSTIPLSSGELSILDVATSEWQVMIEFRRTRMQNACPQCGKAWDDHTWDGQTRTVVTCPSCQIQINTTGLLLGVGAVPAEHAEESSPEMPSSVQTASLDPGNRFGKYVRTKLLGEGGMGQVWMAWDTEISRWIALKIPKVDDPSELARLKSEAQAAGRLSHPNVAAVYELGQAQGRHFIAMEYVNGVTLSDYPRGDRKKLVSFVQQACLGVSYANTHGIVHRDLKPANIMIHREREQVYVMDFGIARQATSVRVSTSVVGTPAYMSPEQAQGERADERSDVWSLGVTLYELLSDHMPFEGVGPMGTLRKVVEEEPRPLHHVDPDLNAIVMKSLEKDCARRYATAQTLADDLGRWLREEPILAHPPSVFYRLRKKLRRHRGVTVTGVLALILTLVAVAAIHKQKQTELGAVGAQLTIARDADRLLEAGRIALDQATAYLYEGDASYPQLLGLIDKGQRPISEALMKAPKSAKAHFLLGRAMDLRGNATVAQSSWRKALALDPHFAEAHFYLGRTLLERSYTVTLFVRPKELESILPESLRLAEDGRTHLQMARDGGLEDPLEDLFSSAMIAYARKDKGAVTRFVADAVARFHRRRGVEQFHWLSGLIADGDQAIQAYSRAISLRPHYPLAYFCRAQSRDVEHREETIADYNKTIELSPQFAPAYNGRGYVQGDINDLRRTDEEVRPSLADFSKAIELDPEYYAAYRNRGLLRKRLKDYAGALADFSKAIELKSDVWSNYVDRAFAKDQLGDHQGWEQDLRTLIALNSEGKGTPGKRMWPHMFLGEFENAIADLDEKIRNDPKVEPEDYDFRGLFKRAIKDYDGAIEDFNISIGFQPKSINATYFERGVTYYCKRNWVHALQDFREELQRDPALNYVHLWLWLTRSRLGEGEGARAELAATLGEWRKQGPQPTWEKYVACYLIGEQSESWLQEQVKKEDAVFGKKANASFYIGMKRITAGDNAGGREFLKKSLNPKPGPRWGDDYCVAIAELLSMDGPK